MNRDDRRTLDRLEAVSAQYRELATAQRALRARRDFLINAAVRRGISYRTIARAAGLHFSRIQQLAEASEAPKEPCLMCAMQAQLPPLRPNLPMETKPRRRDPRRADTTHPPHSPRA